MSKSEQTGGSSPRKEPKPKQKRPWRKPRLYLVDFAVTGAGPVAPGNSYYRPESTLHPLSTPYDPNISGASGFLVDFRHN